MAFFDEIGKRLTAAGQSVAQQTKNFADVTQLNSAISENEKKIAQLISDLGQIYYENHKEDGAAEGLETIQAINALYAEITENREKIKQIKGIVKCENCGADVALSAAFCNACGTRVNRESTEVPDDGQRRCPSCGFIVGDSAFCTQCGTKIDG